VDQDVSPINRSLLAGKSATGQEGRIVGRFENQVAIVTGGGRGIGRDVALLLAREGASVVVNDLGGAVSGGGSDKSVAASVVEDIHSAGGIALANGADAATMTGAASIVNDAISNYGRVDILFNGASIIRRGSIHDMEEDVWDSVMRVNLKSAYAMSRHVAPHMMKQRNGSIISVTSPSGFGHYAMSAYAASKEGLVAFTRSIARELGEYGVRCNAIRPCAASRMFLPEIANDMQYVIEELGVSPVGGQWFSGLLNAEEPPALCEHVASVVAWLCLPQTEPLNGRVLYIAGGHLALCAEPELIRSRFNASGWDLDSLLAEPVVTQFTYDQRNHFARRDPA
jgi:NAD(P)-dependent dehydrogenase (short-subunit alcohol dehydrogenase family)